MSHNNSSKRWIIISKDVDEEDNNRPVCWEKTREALWACVCVLTPRRVDHWTKMVLGPAGV